MQQQVLIANELCRYIYDGCLDSVCDCVGRYVIRTYYILEMFRLSYLLLYIFTVWIGVSFNYERFVNDCIANIISIFRF